MGAAAGAAWVRAALPNACAMPYLCVEGASVRREPIANTRGRLGLILRNSQGDFCNAENDDAVAHVQDVKREQGVAQASDASVREGGLSL